MLGEAVVSTVGIDVLGINKARVQRSGLVMLQLWGVLVL